MSMVLNYSVMILLSSTFVSKRPVFLFTNDGFDALMLQKKMMMQLFRVFSNKIVIACS